MTLSNFSRNIVCLATVALTLIAATPTSLAYSTDYYTSTSALAQGKWVKIKVNDEGIHQITYDELREYGFSDPSQVKVYGYSSTLLAANTFDASLADDLPEMPSVHNGQRILFYAIPDVRFDLKLYEPSATSTKIYLDGNVVRNHFANAGYYFLSDSNPKQNKKTMQTVAASTASGRDTYVSHYSVQFSEKEVQNPSESGALFFGDIIPTLKTLTTFTVNVKDYQTDVLCKYKPRLYHVFSAKSSMSVAPAHIMPQAFSFADSTVTRAPGISTTALKYATGYFGGNITPTDTTIPDGQYDIQFFFNSSSDPTYLAHDYMWFAYPRRNRLTDGQMTMNFIKPTTACDFKLEDVPDGSLVWNITDPSNIYKHEIVKNSDGSMHGSFDKDYTIAAACRLLVFNPAATDFAGVEFCQAVANQDIHSTKVPNMAIITTRTFYDKALEIAEAHHKYDNITVNVYLQDEIFNEFSSGTPSPMAIRRFAKMLYDREPKTFKYLMFYGPSSWDNRAIQIDYHRDNLITYQTELVRYSRDTTRSFSHDQYFGFVKDTYDPSKVMFAQADIAVGRIPVSDLTTASEVNEKIIRHLQTEPSAKAFATAIYLSDSGDSNQHFQQSEEAISEMLVSCPKLNPVKAHNLIFPVVRNHATQATKIITEALTGGAGYFTYSGHADHIQFTSNSLWSISLASSTKYNRYPLAMLATCSAFCFDLLDDDIGQRMLRTPEGGAIGVIAAGRSVYLEYNQTINLAVGRAYAASTADTRIGDIFRTARNSAVLQTNDPDEAVNVLCYNLGGDPALKVNAPTNNIVVTAINGNEISADAATQIAPLTPFTISGKITNADGETDTSFNGKLTIKIFDAPYTVKTTDKSAGYVDCTIDQETLAETVVRVQNGTFTANMFTPVPAHTGTSNRMMLSAVSDDDKTVALGTSKDVAIAGDNTETITASAPVIKQFYIGDESFTDGGVVRGDIDVHAVITIPETGIRVASSIGSALTLTLDNYTTYPGAANALDFNDDGTATINYAMTGVTDGRHTLCLKIADNAGNTTSSTLAFTFINAPATLTLSADKTTVRDQVEFDITHDFSDSPDARLVIRDKDNNTVYSRSGATFPMTWDLKDNTGNDVPNGYYSAFVIANSSDEYASSSPLQLTVLRRATAK